MFTALQSIHTTKEKFLVELRKLAIEYVGNEVFVSVSTPVLQDIANTAETETIANFDTWINAKVERSARMAMAAESRGDKLDRDSWGWIHNIYYAAYEIIFAC